MSETDYPRIKVVMYLTQTTASTGALRLLPGSHRASFHERLLCMDQAHGVHTSDPRWQAATFGLPGEQLPGFAIESNPGDVIMFVRAAAPAFLPKASKEAAARSTIRPTTRFTGISQAATSWR